VSREQRDALTSPLRLEILGQFTEPTPLSVRDLARRMGRTPHSIYYHVHLMARVGLLREVGQRREGGGRSEALYKPMRDRVASKVRSSPPPAIPGCSACGRTFALRRGC
jgi:predicted transcriptional regulator